MKAYTFSILRAVSTNSKVANECVKNKVDEHTRSSKFGDPSLSDATTVLNLVEKIRPGAVDWDLEKAAQSDEEKLANAVMLSYHYQHCSQNSSKSVQYVLPEDFVEVNEKMMLTIFASLMVRGISNSSSNGQKSH
ncbi:plastin-2-like [Plakobranchus ocellatus]|uniref:Plastin-2-like n=1 Tax=Plakobranchus ocellatus TaxID=259542 RepID=A0AAV4A3R2_9GAST|nr:plastin-2-like [Plakobranchus ocellatus]